MEAAVEAVAEYINATLVIGGSRVVITLCYHTDRHILFLSFTPLLRILRDTHYTFEARDRTGIRQKTARQYRTTKAGVHEQQATMAKKELHQRTAE